MPATNHLLIRADVSSIIGSGHVMRCLALAQQWQAEGGRTTFVCSELPEVFGDRLRSEACEVVMIDAAIGSQEDAAATVNLARDLDAVVVADGYRFSVDFQEAVHRDATMLLVLDDFGQIGSYCADLILDQNLGTTDAIYTDRPADCRLILGPEYVMLRREFLDAGEDRREAVQTVRNILVTTGGADVGGLAGKVIGVLNEVPETLSITVVVGGAGPDKGAVEAQARKSHHRIRLIENSDNMSELMCSADIAIGSAGSTVWELAFLGVPSILGAVAENQRVGISALEKTGAVVVFDAISPSATDELRRLLGGVIHDEPRRSAMTEVARRLVDGKGAARVVRAVTSALA